MGIIAPPKPTIITPTTTTEYPSSELLERNASLSFGGSGPGSFSELGKIIRLRGVAEVTGLIEPNIKLFKLAEGYRPAKEQKIGVPTFEITIKTNGEVSASVALTIGQFLALDGITFSTL
jgi:hypothetical protein